MFSFGKNTFKRTRGGVTPGHFKNTRDCATEQLPIPDTVRIPMARGVDSLNVAAASAVAFWQLRARA